MVPASVQSATLLNAQASLFSSVQSRHPERNISIREFLSHVQDGFWATPVNMVRNAPNASEARNIKELLPPLKPSGTFRTSRAGSLIKHSGVLCLDFDKVGTGLAELKNLLRSDPHVLAFFLSPSGTGLKVLMPVCASDADQHKRCWEAASHYFAGMPGGETLDGAPKNISSNCFVSYDPDTWTASGELVPFTPPNTPLQSKQENTISENSVRSISHISSNHQIRYSAERRLAALPMHLRAVFRNYLENRDVHPGGRHQLLKLVIPPLYTVLSPPLIIRLLMLHYDLQSGTWRTPRDSHRAEIDEMLTSWPDSYPQSLSPDACTYYKSLRCENTRCAFRICCDLARKRETFFLSAGHLGKRLELGCEQAKRILKGFEADNVIAPVKKGGIWASGHTKQATLWKWLLARPAMPQQGPILAVQCGNEVAGSVDNEQVQRAPCIHPA